MLGDNLRKVTRQMGLRPELREAVRVAPVSEFDRIVTLMQDSLVVIGEAAENESARRKTALAEVLGAAVTTGRADWITAWLDGVETGGMPAKDRFSAVLAIGNGLGRAGWRMITNDLDVPVARLAAFALEHCVATTGDHTRPAVIVVERLLDLCGRDAFEPLILPLRDEVLAWMERAPEAAAHVPTLIPWAAEWQHQRLAQAVSTNKVTPPRVTGPKPKI